MDIETADLATCLRTPGPIELIDQIQVAGERAPRRSPQQPAEKDNDDEEAEQMKDDTGPFLDGVSAGSFRWRAFRVRGDGGGIRSALRLSAKGRRRAA